MKLGMKIGLGFAAVLAIAAVLGGMAIINMGKVETKSISLQREYVPEVSIASKLERSVHETMYAFRGYGYTTEEKFLEQGRTKLKEVYSNLKVAMELADNSSNLKALRPAAEQADGLVREYEQLAEQTVKVNAAMGNNRAQLDEAAAQYMDVSTRYLNAMHETFKNDLAAGREASRLAEMVEKIRLANEIIDLGNASRILAWRAQALRSPEIMESAYANFPKIENVIDELVGVTIRQIIRDQLNSIRAAGQQYRSAMQAFLQNWQTNEQLSVQRGQIGDKVIAQAMSVSNAGMDGTVNIADDAVSSLSKASNIMVVGLIVALVFGMTIAYFITRAITRPIIKGVAFAQSVSDGDLSQKLDIKQKDEVGQLASALNEMVDRLKNVVNDVRSAADNVAAGSQELSASSEEMSQGATEQAAAA
ncbi:MAG: methyl-accepting chemotaxis protein, partial [Desulfuromonadaceae bacterium]